MRHASAVTLKAYEAAWKSLKEGMTQGDFARLVSQAHEKLGFSGGAGVQVGEFSALPHGSITPQVVKEGSILLIDGGCKVEGYSSDLSRTFVLGKPTDKMKQVFDIEHAAQTAALKAARPGVPCGDIDAAARKVIEDGGYGPGYKYFTHRVGHGWNGRSRVAVSREGEHAPARTGDDVQRRARDLHPRRVRRAARGRLGRDRDGGGDVHAAVAVARGSVRGSGELRMRTKRNATTGNEMMTDRSTGMADV
jgi:hypothetical protein